MVGSHKWTAQAEMLVNRIRKNRRRLKSWIRTNRITCYRLYNRDIPEIPLAVDWYDGRLHIASYRKSRTVDRAPREWLDHLASHLAAALSVPAQAVFVKERRQAPGGTQYTRLGSAKQRFTVQENDLSFIVNLSDYLDTGLFLDHRETRRRVMADAKDKRFLNLFAYTGAFTVYAAAGGARETTSVDLSNTYLDWAKENMAQNGFSGETHRFVRDDILSTLESGRLDTPYDLVVIDPPTVSVSKAMSRTFDVQQDHGLLLSCVLERIPAGGVIYFSNNFKKFKLSPDSFGCTDIVDLTEITAPPDYGGKFAHHCYRMTKQPT